jgi:tRNA A-37 threonylcarbamoyl transferase component Bud32
VAAVLSIVWVERCQGLDLPPLDAGLSGWEVTQRRASHWNARRHHGDAVFHLKWFFHGPWRRPARTEWRSAARVASLGIPTVIAAGWGRHPRGSFVLLLGSPGRPLDKQCARGLAPAALTSLASRLAALVARLHDAGLCHRDLNVYHVLESNGDLRLIDVGRVAPFRRRRWIVKDLASLCYTAGREGLPAAAARSFLGAYLRATRRRWRRRELLRAILRKAAAYRRHNEGPGRSYRPSHDPSRGRL